jgi:hypothetical protein
MSFEVWRAHLVQEPWTSASGLSLSEVRSDFSSDFVAANASIRRLRVLSSEENDQNLRRVSDGLFSLVLMTEPSLEEDFEIESFSDNSEAVLEHVSSAFEPVERSCRDLFVSANLEAL